MSKRWNVASPWIGRTELADRLNVPTLVAQLLHNRDVTDVEEAKSFLDPQLSRLAAPDEIPNATLAAERLVDAVRAGRRIVIYGDYDVDGITGIAILWHCLKLMGADPDYYVPHRLEEGYGVNGESIRQLAADGAQVIVTVDCGITARAEATLARELGVEFIVTDHHEIEEPLPEAAAIVHPRLENDDGPCAQLAGAGVAFKLAWAMARHFVNAEKVTPEFRDFLVDATGLAALGTIADVVPLQGENRILAHFGLQGLAAGRLMGVRALLESARLTSDRLSSYDVGFKLAPRLNAAGRMGHARLAADLLTRADARKAAEIAQYLEQQNRQRQTIERKITEQAKRMVEQAGMDAPDCRAIVLAAPDWHPGVIGIVASRMVDAFCRPAILIGLSGEAGQGSGRSIEGFDLFAALQHCRDCLQTFGGHKMAAGIKITKDNVPVLTKRLTEYANEHVTESQLTSSLRIDAAIELSVLDEPLVRRMESLAPFGMGNPKPRLCTDWCDLAGDPRRVGQSAQHLQFALRRDNQVIKAIAFGRGELADELAAKRKCKVAFQPIINEYMGRRNVELKIDDIQLPEE